MKTPTKVINFVDRGMADWNQVNENFDHISDDIDELDERLKRLDNRTGAQVVTYLLEGEGYVTVLKAKEHGNTKLVHAIMQAADNVKENITVHILRENKDLCEPVTIKSTEKAGKAQTFEPFKTQVIGKIEDVKLYSNCRRKVIITLVFSTVGVKQ